MHSLICLFQWGNWVRLWLHDFVEWMSAFPNRIKRSQDFFLERCKMLRQALFCLGSERWLWNFDKVWIFCNIKWLHFFHHQRPSWERYWMLKLSVCCLLFFVCMRTTKAITDNKNIYFLLNLKSYQSQRTIKYVFANRYVYIKRSNTCQKSSRKVKKKK